MSIRYSYSDFTTKGHGVIEGFWGRKKQKKTRHKKKRKKVTKNIPAKSDSKQQLQATYNHLMKIHEEAQRRRNIKKSS